MSKSRDSLRKAYGRIFFGSVGAGLLIAASIATGASFLMTPATAHAAMIVHSKCVPQPQDAASHAQNGASSGVTVYSPDTLQAATGTKVPVQAAGPAYPAACAKTMN